jgi:hypothetical protein
LGVLGEVCLSEASSAAAQYYEQRRNKAEVGCSFIWLFSFEQAKVK